MQLVSWSNQEKGRILPLHNFNVIAFESRKKDAMVQLIEKQGGKCFSAPSMREVPLEDNKDIDHFSTRLFNKEIDVLICLTGVGTRSLLEQMQKNYSKDEIVEAISYPVIVSRGPKPTRVLKEYQIPVSIQVPEPNTWRQVIQELDDYEELDGLKGKTVAVQEYGIPNQKLADGLKKRGALVMRVPIYRWALPEDINPLKSAIDRVIQKEADACLFTSATQIHHVLRIASEEGKDEAFKKGCRDIAIASIGPVCTQSLQELGIDVDIEPEHSTIGAFVLEVSKKIKDIAIEKSAPSVHVEEKKSAIQKSEKNNSDELHNSLLMRAIRREEVDRTPIWLMRQAGRYMKEYRDIRKKHSFLDLCKNTDLVTEITVTAQEKLGADAAIIFSDILVLVEPLGMSLEYSRNEGPVIQLTLDEGKSVDDLNDVDIKSQLGFVLEGIQKTRAQLKSNIPLLGFAGAPFTLASYMIEGGTSKTFRRTKEFMYKDKGRWDELMERISSSLIDFLSHQFEAGVQAVQLFDSWVGCLGPEDYRDYVMPYSQKVLQAVEKKGPTIHFGTGIASLLEDMSLAGGQVMGIDYRLNLSEAWSRIGYQKAVQGNLDPLVLYSDKKFIKKRVQSILDQVGNRPGHIFNLGHGILPETPFENAKYLIDIVHELSAS